MEDEGGLEGNEGVDDGSGSDRNYDDSGSDDEVEKSENRRQVSGFGLGRGRRGRLVRAFRIIYLVAVVIRFFTPRGCIVTTGAAIFLSRSALTTALPRQKTSDISKILEK